METFWLEVFGVLCLILLVGFFSAAEVAVLSTRKSRMKELADEGDRRAAIVLAFQNDPEHFLATVHVGIIFSLILAAGLGGIIGLQVLSPALAASNTPWISEASHWISLAVMVLHHRVDGGGVRRTGSEIPRPALRGDRRPEHRGIDALLCHALLLSPPTFSALPATSSSNPSRTAPPSRSRVSPKRNSS